MSIDWVPTKGPKTKRLAEARMHQLLFMEAMTRDALFLETARKEIPEAWHTLEMDVEVETPKEKVTLYLDRAVIRMFRKMGKGYQARINRVLETYLQLRIAEKSVLKKEMMQAVAEARDDSKRPEVGEEMKKLYKEQLESEAYAEGFADAVRRYENGIGL